MSESLEELSSDIKFVREVYNEALRYCNRLWLSAVFFGLIYFSAQFSSDSGDGDGKLFWFMEAEFAEQAMLFALAGANIAYCNSHIVAYRLAKVWNNLPKKTQFLYLAPGSAFNRLYPSLGGILSPNLYGYAKIFFDLVIGGLPAGIMLFGTYSILLDSAKVHPIVLYSLLALVIVSSLFTVLLGIELVGYGSRQGRNLRGQRNDA